MTEREARAIGGRRQLLITAGLIAVLMVAAIARFWALDFGLPLPLARPDENHVWSHATRILEGDWRPARFAYPALMPMVNASVRWVAGLIGFELPWSDPDAAPYPEAAWVSRAISATAGVATVLLVFLIGRRVRSTAEGLLAASLLAVTHLHCRDSHFGVTDVPMTFGIVFVFWLLLKSASLPRVGRFLLCGAALGGAISVKQPALFVFAPMLMAAFGSTQGDGREPRDGLGGQVAVCSPTSIGQRTVGGIGALLLAAAAAAGVFLLLNPFTVLEYERFFEDVLGEFVGKTEARNAGVDRGWIGHARFSLWYGLGPPYSVAAAAGVVFACIARRWNELLLVVLALAIYAGMGSGTRYYVRYMLPLTPIAALLAARAIGAVSARLREGWRGCAMVSLGVAIAIPSCSSVLATNRLLGERDTRLLAWDYLRERVLPEERVLWIGRYCSPPTWKPDPRFVVRDDDFVEKLLANRVEPAAAFAGAGFQWVVVAEHELRSQFDLRPATAEKVIAALETIELFSPTAAGADRLASEAKFDRCDMFYLPYSGFTGFERPGPRMRILRTRR